MDANFSEMTDTKTMADLSYQTQETDVSETSPSTLVKINDNPREWARQQLLWTNPWDLFNKKFNEIYACPMPSDAIEVILKDASCQPLQAKEAVAHLVVDIVDSAEEDMDPPAKRYRRWMKPLRMILEANPNAGRVKRLITDLMSDQSMPFDELDLPDFIDAFTGEVDHEALEERKRVESLSPEEREELFGSVAVEESLNYVEGFNSEDGMESMYGPEIVEEDVKIPMWEEMQNDVRPTDGLSTVRKETGLEVHNLRKAIQTLVDFHSDTTVAEIEARRVDNWQREDPVTYLEGTKGVKKGAVKQAMRSSKEAQEFVDRLTELAYEGAQPADLATVWIQFQHSLGFNWEDAKRVDLPSGTLLQWLEDVGKSEFLESLEMRLDGMIRADEPTQDEIDAFDLQTMQLILEKCPPADLSLIAKKQQRIDHTREYVEAFIQTAINCKSRSYTVNGRKHDRAAEAGFHAVLALCPEGHQAYKHALLDGKSLKEAMFAFWQFANDPNKIVKIGRNGLTLSSGRQINWYIARMKFQKGEMKTSPADRLRLKELLQANGWGLELVPVL